MQKRIFYPTHFPLIGKKISNAWVAHLVKRAKENNKPHHTMNYEDSDHGFQLYLRQISQYPLLTPAQELSLAAKIKKGNKAASAEMIRANLRLVVKIARDYANLGMPLLDLISEGNIGLMKAVERFDPAKGGKLSTYGSWWIKQSIKRALANQGKTIRLPVHLVDKIAKIRRVGAGLSDELGREATDEEIAEEVGMNASKVTQLKQAAIRPASLDALSVMRTLQSSVSSWVTQLPSIPSRASVTRTCRWRWATSSTNSMTASGRSSTPASDSMVLIRSPLRRLVTSSASPARGSASFRTSLSPRCARLLTNASA
jgi:hypothetical protein